MQYGHAVERRPDPGRVDNAAHRRPDLLVAVRDGQDLCPVGAHDVHGLAVAGMRPVPTHANPTYRPLDLGIRPGVPGGPRQDDDVAGVGHGAEEGTTMA